MPVEKEEIRSEITRTLGDVQAVLDVGSGNCDLVLFLAREIAQEAVGIDINGHIHHECINVEGDDAAHTARCVHMDAGDMTDLEDDRFDAVVSTHALHEIDNPQAALAEIRRVLKPRGILFIADFTDGETRWDEDYFTPAQVREMLHGAHFQSIAVQKVPGEAFMYARASK
ncbi:MAG: class I SAM-dependent methyltransferase [Armatimonadota bacterium]